MGSGKWDTLLQASTPSLKNNIPVEGVTCTFLYFSVTDYICFHSTRLLAPPGSFPFPLPLWSLICVRSMDGGEGGAMGTRAVRMLPRLCQGPLRIASGKGRGPFWGLRLLLSVVLIF
jgi:hypothetical protein